MTYVSLGLHKVIDKFAVPIVVIREAGAVYQNGYLTKGVVTNYNIMGVIQPLKANEAYYLPQGIQAEDVRNLWINNVQLLGSPLAETPFLLTLHDKIQYNGDIFTVMSIQDWSAQGQFYKARIAIVRGQI